MDGEAGAISSEYEDRSSSEDEDSSCNEEEAPTPGRGAQTKKRKKAQSITGKGGEGQNGRKAPKVQREGKREIKSKRAFCRGAT